MIRYSIEFYIRSKLSLKNKLLSFLTEATKKRSQIIYTGIRNAKKATFSALRYCESKRAQKSAENISEISVYGILWHLNIEIVSSATSSSTLTLLHRGFCSPEYHVLFTAIKLSCKIVKIF